MPTHADLPYVDPEPLPEMVEECRCVEAECTAHGVDLHPGHRPEGPHPTAVTQVDDATGHLVDGLPPYGC